MARTPQFDRSGVRQSTFKRHPHSTKQGNDDQAEGEWKCFEEMIEGYSSSRWEWISNKENAATYTEPIQPTSSTPDLGSSPSSPVADDAQITSQGSLYPSLPPLPTQTASPQPELVTSLSGTESAINAASKITTQNKTAGGSRWSFLKRVLYVLCVIGATITTCFVLHLAFPHFKTMLKESLSGRMSHVKRPVVNNGLFAASRELDVIPELCDECILRPTLQRCIGQVQGRTQDEGRAWEVIVDRLHISLTDIKHGMTSNNHTKIHEALVSMRFNFPEQRKSMLRSLQETYTGKTSCLEAMADETRDRTGQADKDYTKYQNTTLSNKDRWMRQWKGCLKRLDSPRKVYRTAAGLIELHATLEKDIVQKVDAFDSQIAQAPENLESRALQRSALDLAFAVFSNGSDSFVASEYWDSLS